MGNSVDRAWQLSQLMEGVSTACNPSMAACLAVLSALLAIQLFGNTFPPPNFSKEYQTERCGHSRSQRSFITFHGALQNTLLSAGFPVTIHMIVLEQTFVNDSLQKIFSRWCLFWIESIISVIHISLLTYLYFLRVPSNWDLSMSHLSNLFWDGRIKSGSYLVFIWTCTWYFILSTSDPVQARNII